MSSYPGYPGAPYSGQPVPPPVVVTEKVGLGLLFSLVAIPVGMIVAVALWRVGFIAGISSFVIAAGAVFLYTKGAGAAPRTGLIPLVVVILGGVVLSFFAVVGSDLYDVYGQLGLGASGASRAGFIRGNLFNGDVLSAYKGRDLIFFVVFAALGVFSTLRRVVAAR